MFSSREKVVEALTELGVRLDARGIHGDIYIVGGTAMLLGYDRLVVTSDIDAVFTPVEVINEIVAEMYIENKRLGPKRGLPEALLILIHIRRVIRHHAGGCHLSDALVLVVLTLVLMRSTYYVEVSIVLF